MKRKRLVAALLLLLIFGTTTAYAYWDRTQVTTPSNTIQLGVGATLEVTETIGGSGSENLIPYGAFRGENEVYEVVFAYDIELNKAGKVAILAKNITIDGSEDNAVLVLIDIYETDPNVVPTNGLLLTLTGSAGEYEGSMFVKVMLSMPTSQAQYDAVAGKEISFVIEFSAEEL